MNLIKSINLACANPSSSRQNSRQQSDGKVAADQEGSEVHAASNQKIQPGAGGDVGGGGNENTIFEVIHDDGVSDSVKSDGRHQADAGCPPCSSGSGHDDENQAAEVGKDLEDISEEFRATATSTPTNAVNRMRGIFSVAPRDLSPMHGRVKTNSLFIENSKVNMRPLDATMDEDMEEVAHNEKENVFTPEEEAECDQEVANIFARCDDEEIDEELNRLAKAALEAATNINDDSDFSIHGSDEVGKLSADGGDILTRNEEKNIDEDIITLARAAMQAATNFNNDTDFTIHHDDSYVDVVNISSRTTSHNESYVDVVNISSHHDESFIDVVNISREEETPLRSDLILIESYEREMCAKQCMEEMALRPAQFNVQELFNNMIQAQYNILEWFNRMAQEQPAQNCHGQREEDVIPFRSTRRRMQLHNSVGIAAGQTAQRYPLLPLRLTATVHQEQPIDVVSISSDDEAEDPHGEPSENVSLSNCQEEVADQQVVTTSEGVDREDLNATRLAFVGDEYHLLEMQDAKDSVSMSEHQSDETLLAVADESEDSLSDSDSDSERGEAMDIDCQDEFEQNYLGRGEMDSGNDAKKNQKASPVSSNTGASRLDHAIFKESDSEVMEKDPFALEYMENYEDIDSHDNQGANLVSGDSEASQSDYPSFKEYDSEENQVMKKDPFAPKYIENPEDIDSGSDSEESKDTNDPFAQEYMENHEDIDSSSDSEVSQSDHSSFEESDSDSQDSEGTNDPFAQEYMENHEDIDSDSQDTNSVSGKFDSYDESSSFDTGAKVLRWSTLWARRSLARSRATVLRIPWRDGYLIARKNLSPVFDALANNATQNEGSQRKTNEVAERSPKKSRTDDGANIANQNEGCQRKANEEAERPSKRNRTDDDDEDKEN